MDKNNLYEVQELIINNDGKKIFGYLYMPKTSKKVPLVIYSHELANTHEKGIFYAEKLASKKIAMYTFDYPGGSNDSKSTGLTTEMSILTEANTLTYVLSYFRKTDYIDTNNIFILGASLGGYVASFVCSQKEKWIKGLILMYPGFNVYDTCHNTFNSLEEVPKEFSFRGWINVGKKFVQDIWYDNYFESFKKYLGNVLILHGLEDKIVPLDYSLNILTYFNNVNLVIIKGATHHIFFHEQRDVAFSYIYKFIKENISKNN